MNNKEQIIIDGVDVSGCISLDEWKHCNCCNDLIKTVYPNATKCHTEGDLRCETYPNCYYKQLARKTKELEVICKAFDIEYVYDDGKMCGRSNKLQSLEQEFEQEFRQLKEELFFLNNNEDLLISNLQLLWGKQIAEEQDDCKNIDYSKPRTKEIYHKITEIDRTLKDVAFAQSVNIGKTKPLGNTGSPKSYKRWEARERKLLEREFLK